jgi:hypothetical protein
LIWRIAILYLKFITIDRFLHGFYCNDYTLFCQYQIFRPLPFRPVGSRRRTDPKKRRRSAVKKAAVDCVLMRPDVNELATTRLEGKGRAFRYGSVPAEAAILAAGSPPLLKAVGMRYRG